MNSFAYGHEQLLKSVSYLATQDDPPAQRLERVVQDNLCHITPENDLREELRDEFIGIMKRLGEVWVASKDGTLVRAARTMTDDEVFSTIDKIVYLFDRLCETA